MRRWRPRQVQPSILSQDRRFQIAQRRPRLDGQLAAEERTQPPVHAERVGLAAAAIQREHQLSVELLVERVIPGERLEIRQDLPVLTQREPGLHQLPAGPQPQLLQALGLLPQPGQAVEAG